MPLSVKGVQPFGVSGPHWKKSCLGSHIKYVTTHNHTQNNPHYVLSKLMILSWAVFTAMLGHKWPMGHGLDSPVRVSKFQEVGNKC